MGLRKSLRSSRLLRAAILVAGVFVLLPYALVPLYRFINPVSTLMVWRWVSGQRVERTFVPLAQIGPTLPLTVILAEDGRYCSHHGVDFQELRGIVEDAEDFDQLRGGSTITQQAVKNLFLWPGRSVVRKILELPLAMWADLVLPKRRIMEIYLNIAEWGPERRNSEPRRAPALHSASRRDSSVRAKPPCWRRSCPIRRSAAPASRAAMCSAWLAFTGRALARSAWAADCVRPRPTPWRREAITSLRKAGALVFAPAFLYKPPHLTHQKDLSALCAGVRLRRLSSGRSKKKNLALPPRDAPFRRCAEEAGLRRGQGFRRAAPPAPHRPEDRQI